MEHLIFDLEKLYLQIPFLRIGKHDDPKFENWKAKAVRTIKKTFGEESQEHYDFIKIQYWYMYGGIGYEKISKEEFDKINFQKGLDKADFLLQDLIDEAKVLLIKKNGSSESTTVSKSLFISHSSKDRAISKEIINLLEACGVPSNLIFNSSMPGYGVKPGEDWVETLKAKISTDGVVISLISENYYKSAVSLCEMGATWVLSKTHFPILIPPLTFEEVKGVIPTKHGIMINDSERWSELKEELEKIFKVKPIPVAKWEGKKKDILERIEKLLAEK